MGLELLLICNALPLKLSMHIAFILLRQLRLVLCSGLSLALVSVSESTPLLLNSLIAHVSA